MSGLDNSYNWEVAISVGGITWTSPGCDSKMEAESLMLMVKDKTDVDKAEVQRR